MLYLLRKPSHYLSQFWALISAAFAVLFAREVAIKVTCDAISKNTGGCVVFVYSFPITLAIHLTASQAARLAESLLDDDDSEPSPPVIPMSTGPDASADYPAAGELYANHFDPTTGKLQPAQ